jgi:biopolymer transport protein ExbB/TolQ
MGASGISRLTALLGSITYLALFLIAVWGAYCLIIVWRRIAQKSFRSEAEQEDFLDQVDASLRRGDLAGLATELEGNLRAVPQLVLTAIENRGLGYERVRDMVVDRFQRDVMADLEYRLSWVQTIIKAAPMVGLFGTVLGMMGAFAKLAAAESVEPTALAEDISLALYTTAFGLAIAIPLVLCMASVNVRIRKLEDLVEAGVTRFFESFRAALGTTPSAVRMR